MAESATPMEQVARDVRLAYETGDVERFGALLAPHVTWGPPGGPSTCRSKSQVLTWYQNGANAGARAQVRRDRDRRTISCSSASPSSGTPQRSSTRGRASRWQVLTVSGSLDRRHRRVRAEERRDYVDVALSDAVGVELPRDGTDRAVVTSSERREPRSPVLLAHLLCDRER